jgi:hypothetical protein
MITRVRTKTVIFTRPFVLNEADGEQPAGIYTVETEEQSLDGHSMSVFRHMSTTIYCYHSKAKGGGSIRSLSVDPSELAAAQARDALPPACRSCG